MLREVRPGGSRKVPLGVSGAIGRALAAVTKANGGTCAAVRAELLSELLSGQPDLCTRSEGRSRGVVVQRCQ